MQLAHAGAMRGFVETQAWTSIDNTQTRHRSTPPGDTHRARITRNKHNLIMPSFPLMLSAIMHRPSNYHGDASISPQKQSPFRRPMKKAESNPQQGDSWSPLNQRKRAPRPESPSPAHRP